MSDIHQYEHANFTISTDSARLDVESIHAFLAHESAWAAGRAKEVVIRSIKNSLSFGLYDGDKQIGFARVISDYATYAFLDDVFLLEPYRGQGLGKWLIKSILSHPDLQNITRFSLVTIDKQAFYAEFGWQPVFYPNRHMERLPPGYY